MTRLLSPGKTAIVTGGASGLGFAVATRLADEGFRVRAISRRNGFDVTNLKDIRSLAPADVLVNCAGSLTDCWRVNVMGTIRMCQLVYAHNIVTIAGGGVGGPDLMRENHPYVISKAAIVAFTESVAPELARQGSVINCVSPGSIKSEMNPGGGDPSRACELISWLCSDECKVTGQLFGARYWTRGDPGGVLRWTPCE